MGARPLRSPTRSLCFRISAGATRADAGAAAVSLHGACDTQKRTRTFNRPDLYSLTVLYGAVHLCVAMTVQSGQVRSGLLLGPTVTRPKSKTMRATRRLLRLATSEVTSLESSYARIFRDDTAEPTTNVAEYHNDVLQAADLYVRGSPDQVLLQLRKSRNLFTSL